MNLNHNVFDLWIFHREPKGGTKYLLLKASKEKADRHFNGVQFWQIPCQMQVPELSLIGRAEHLLSSRKISAKSIWAVEHAYTIYNRRFDEMQLISVFAAEVDQPQEYHFDSGHAEYGWFTYAECQEKLNYRGLKEGLYWLRQYISENPTPSEEFRLA